MVLLNHRIKPEHHAYFMEVSQGFSLGINSEFYPKVTSRECTVMQGLADARLAPRHLSRTYLAIRSYPIRVGNVDGYSSGDWYSDQYEIDWAELGVTPEITTVTRRIRRVASFSMDQFHDACLANDPDFVFISHLDYLNNPNRQTFFIEDIQNALDQMDKRCEIILGEGPRVEDIRLLETSNAD